MRVLAGMGDLPARVLRRTLHGGGQLVQFGGIESLLEDLTFDDGSGYLTLLVPYRRRLLQVNLTREAGTDRDAALAALARIFAPTLKGR